MNVIKATAAGGNWPVMITPFNEDKSIDWSSLDQLIEWYLGADIQGLFAVCQSSEMFNMSNKERLDLASHVVKRVEGRVPVIATGTFPDNESNQAEMVKKVYDTGVELVVVLTNVFAASDESEDVWIKNIEKLLSQTDDIPLGLYECPFPYKRLIPPETMKWVVETNRFFWSKDTSENIDQIKERLKVLENSNLSLYNAHTGSLLESLGVGVVGFAGIDSNYFPHLYSWMCENWKKDSNLSKDLQEFFVWARNIIDYKYPLSAKEYLVLIDVINNSTTRLDKGIFDRAGIDNLRRMYTEVESWHEKLGIELTSRINKTSKLTV